MEIVNYKIVSGTTAEELKDEVMIAINEGWQPIGSLAVSPMTTLYSFQLLQTLVKYACAHIFAAVYENPPCELPSRAKCIKCGFMP